MINHFTIITINHKNLNTEDLDHFIIRHNDEAELAQKLQDVKARFAQQEAVYLNTCNRVIYFFYGSGQIDNLAEFFEFINPALAQGNHQQIDKLASSYRGLEAIKHIFEVASSIDSLVIGEREIFRQYRQAYQKCRRLNLCGDAMRLVEKSVVKAAKDVYTNTQIGAKPVSVVSLAVQAFLARQLPKDSTILLIGAGETNTTAGRFLKKHGYRNLVIFNRSFDNALKLSDELNAKAMHLTELQEYDGPCDAIFACTAAQDPIVNAEIYHSINSESKECLIIDLSIPHNVSKAVSEHPEVDYISVDSIRTLAEDNLRARSGNIAAARILLNGHLEDFSLLWERRRVEKAFGSLPAAIKGVKERALEQVYKNAIEELPEDTQKLINEIATYMEKKCVAVPMRIAKEA